MIFRASGNVCQWPPKPLFLILDPIKHSTQFQETNKRIYEQYYFVKIKNLEIRINRKRHVLKNPRHLFNQIWKSLSMEPKPLKSMEWKLGNFNSTKGIRTSHPPTPPYPPPSWFTLPPRTGLGGRGERISQEAGGGRGGCVGGGAAGADPGEPGRASCSHSSLRNRVRIL